MRPIAAGNRPRAGAAPAALLIALFVLPAAAAASVTQETADIPGLLREIRAEVLGLGRYAGEDFARGEFFLGPGDDDTNKTHAVGILVQDGAEGSRMTIVVSRLDPDADHPRVKYARDPKTVVGRFAGGAVEVLRSDYPEAELAKLLPAVLKAVVDKKALLKKRALLLPLEAAREFASKIPVRGRGTRAAGETGRLVSGGPGSQRRFPSQAAEKILRAISP